MPRSTVNVFLSGRRFVVMPQRIRFCHDFEELRLRFRCLPQVDLDTEGEA
jgi:hypothetical protein